MLGLGWPEVLALLTSVGFGALSGILPLANAEAYVMLSQVSATAGPVPVAIGIGVGQTIGKLMLFLGVRRGKNSCFAHRQRDKLHRPHAGPTWRRARRLVRQVLNLVGSKRWGLPIVLLAALAGLPPLYAVALLAGATRMRVGWFGLMVIVGRLGRFVLIALGMHHLHPGE